MVDWRKNPALGTRQPRVRVQRKITRPWVLFPQTLIVAIISIITMGV